MANTNSTVTAKIPSVKQGKYTPQGFLSPATLKRFGVKNNVQSQDGDGEKVDTRFSHGQSRWIKKMTELCVTYRMISKQCVSETKLPAPLRNGVKYFSYAMRGGRGDVAPTVSNPPQNANEAAS